MHLVNLVFKVLSVVFQSTSRMIYLVKGLIFTLKFRDLYSLWNFKNKRFFCLAYISHVYLRIYFENFKFIPQIVSKIFSYM